MTLSSMAARLAESGANLSDEAACALALHASGYRPSVIAFELTGAIACGRAASGPTHQCAPACLAAAWRARSVRAEGCVMAWRAGKMSMSRKDWAELNPVGGTLTLVQDGPDVIACVWADEDEDEAKFARLIAAAPSLYGALSIPVVHQIEESEGLIRLSIGGVEVCAHRDGSPEAAALLRFDAEQRAALALAEPRP